MNQQQSFNPDSLVATHAIPRIPYKFTQHLQDAQKDTSCSWEQMLSYSNPLFLSSSSEKKIFIETHPQVFDRAITPVPINKVNAYKDTDFLLVLVLFLITLYGALTVVFSRYLKPIAYAPFIYSESVRLYNDQSAVIPSFFAWLNGIALMVVSIFIYLCFKQYGLYEQMSSILMFLLAMLFAAGFLLFRVLTIKIVGWFLNRRDVFREYLFQNLLYYKMGSLAMLPLLIVAIFSDATWTAYTLAAAAALLLIIHLYIYARGTKIILKKGILIFYWILYLCTAEFVPFLMLYKYISTRVQGG